MLHSTRFLLALVLALTAAACVGEEGDSGNDALDSSGGDASNDSTMPGDTATTADSQTQPDTHGLDTDLPDLVGVCAAVAGFDKGCMEDAGCAVALHTVNCCGTQVAWGINQAELARFAELEALCDATYPACGCAQEATLAEDGTRGFDLGVRCLDGACQTFARDGLCDAVSGFDKGCTATSDCAIGFHQTDCCGSESAVGVHHAALDAFNLAEQACRATLPTCECMSQPMLAEDGQSAADPSLVQVVCDAARGCTTVVGTSP